MGGGKGVCEFETVNFNYSSILDLLKCFLQKKVI